MRKVERRLYGAMLIMCNDEGNLSATKKDIVSTAGYKAYGGMHTYALQELEQENKITKLGDDRWKVFM